MSDKTKYRSNWRPAAIPYLYPPYPIRTLSEVTDCEHKDAQFQGMYSLVGHYHCPDCKSRFCPQEFQKYREGVDKEEL